MCKGCHRTGDFRLLKSPVDLKGTVDMVVSPHVVCVQNGLLCMGPMAEAPRILSSWLKVVEFIAGRPQPVCSLIEQRPGPICFDHVWRPRCRTTARAEKRAFRASCCFASYELLCAPRPICAVRYLSPTIDGWGRRGFKKQTCLEFHVTSHVPHIRSTRYVFVGPQPGLQAGAWSWGREGVH